MTAPHPSTHPTTWPAGYPATPPPARGRRALIVLVAVLAVATVAGITAVAVLLLTRDDRAAPGGTAGGKGTTTVAGELVLRTGQFSFQGATKPPCKGWDKFADVDRGTQVTVTDAAGKVLATGALEQGVTGGLVTLSDSKTRKADTCTFKFQVPGVQRGAGPYGVEVAKRGVTHVDEGQLGAVRLSM